MIYLVANAGTLFWLKTGLGMTRRAVVQHGAKLKFARITLSRKIKLASVLDVRDC